MIAIDSKFYKPAELELGPVVVAVAVGSAIMQANTFELCYVCANKLTFLLCCWFCCWFC